MTKKKEKGRERQKEGGEERLKSWNLKLPGC